MKVVFSDGSKGTLQAEESKNLYLENRRTKEQWQDLENEMKKLDVIKFEDPLLLELGLKGDLITIEYVRNQIAVH